MKEDKNNSFVLQNLSNKVKQVFTGFKQSTPKKRIIFVLSAVAILIIAGGVYYYFSQKGAAKATEAQQATMQTTIATRGDITLLTSGTGQLIAASQMNLGFDESGTLTELNVKVGDKVKSGQVLAKLQTSNTPETIAADISDAELTVVQAQTALDDLYANAQSNRTTALNDIATYAQAVRDAQYQMEFYIMPSYLHGLDPIAALDKTKEELDKANAAFEPYKYLSEYDTKREELLIALNEAQSNYDAAVKRLNYEYVLEVAQANLQKARQEYDKYKNGPAPDELAQAEAELANAKAKLALAKEEQSIIELKSPMDGTVMAINGNFGEFISTSTIITLADLEKPMLEVYVDETDLDKVGVGYEADVVFDALPDKTFKGKVVSVDPGLATVDNVNVIKTIVQLDANSLDPSLNLPIGLSASVDIIAGRAQNVVLIPIEALREVDTGEYGVFVVQSSQLVLRSVTVGLKDVTSAEITSGIEAGETVSTGIVQTK